ncbi:phosphatidate cytidylyltransferase [Bacillus alkalicola]|uniref:Phosphatidate cytidylyltransferase n=1 Tax=Evansella alkalicola TaxID=745819 RepID=A0ABS6JU81_9BACI|nr:phosphatidate cytidylyltransferase [Bacillus alkalicola]
MAETIWILTAIFKVLLTATVIILILNKLTSEKDFRSIFLRLKTWWGMFVIFCFATLFNPVVSLVSIMVLSFFALKEYFSMIESRRQDRRLYLWCYLVIPVHFYWILIDWYGMFIIFIPVYVFLLLPLPRIIGKGTVGFLRSVSTTQWGLMLMVFGLSHLAYFQFATPEYGANLVLFLIILTQVNDMIHNLISIFIGKKSVVPSANSNLTWEGFLGGFLFTTLISFILYPYLTPFGLTFGILSGVIISISGYFGSLTISVLRRDLSLGGRHHNGSSRANYISIVDSLTYTSPIFFHIIRYFFDFM